MVIFNMNIYAYMLHQEIGYGKFDHETYRSALWLLQAYIKT